MKLLLVGLLLLGTGGYYWLQRPIPEVVNTSAPTPSPSPTYPSRVMGLVEYEEELRTVEWGGQVYRYAWEVVPPSAVVTGLNEQLAKSSNQLFTDYQCRVLVNGGFYDTADKPIGLLVDAGQELSPWQKNTLLNGVLFWNKQAAIIDIVHGRSSSSEMWWAVQAGPVVWRDGQEVALQLNRDQEARRMIGGVTDTNELLLLTVVGADSLFGGPKLVDIPGIVGKIQEAIGITLKSAINLDGGTASAFVTSRIQLKELRPIGSFLCIR